MSRQFWSETVSWATASGTTVASTAVETILVPNVTVPANFLQDGRCLRIRGFGAYGTTATPTLLFTLRWGGVAGTVMGKTGAIVTTSGTGGGASMTAPWSFEAVIQVRSNGSSGTLFTMGEVNLYTAVVGTAGTVTNYGMPCALTSGASAAPGTAPTTSTCDLTADTALSFTATWGTSNSANSIVCTNYTVEALN